MNAASISFCDKVAFNINNDEVKKNIIGDLEKHYAIKIITKHYEKFDSDKSIEVVNRVPHLICLRSNGNPYFLHLVKYNFTQYCIFVDKKIQQGYYFPRMVVTRLSFADCLFENGGTLFEGEMIKGSNGWTYSIVDILVHQGKHLIDINLPRRLNVVYHILSQQYKFDDSDVCKFNVKKYFTYQQYGEVCKHVNSLPYTTRGVIFRPLFLKFKDILLNFDDSLIIKNQRQKVGQFIEHAQQIKPLINKETSQTLPTCITELPSKEIIVVHLAQKTNYPDIYMLFEQGTYKDIGVACIQTMVVSKKMRLIFADKNCVDKIPIQCVYNYVFKKWMPICD